MALKKQSLDIMMSQQTSVVKKIFEAVPRNEFWNANKICAEVFRHGTRLDQKTCEGCLNHLVEIGAVIESTAAPGHFCRAPLREDREAKPAPALKAVPDAPKPAAKTPIDTLSEFASSLRTNAAGLHAQADNLLTLADQIDATLLQFMQDQSDCEKQLEKLRAFKNFLKDV